jgi:cell division protease FtsH
MAFGGRAAELIIFNQFTTGAANDIKQATNMARSMVCKWGMSDVVGPMAVGEQSQEVFIGREWVSNKDHSEETARVVDAEVKRIIDSAMNRADALLRENIDCLHRVADALLERETITGDEVRRLMKGESLPPLDLKANPRKLLTTKDLEKGDGASPQGEKDRDRPPSSADSPFPPGPPAGKSPAQRSRASGIPDTPESPESPKSGVESGPAEEKPRPDAPSSTPETPPASPLPPAASGAAGKKTNRSPLGAALSGKKPGADDDDASGPEDS